MVNLPKKFTIGDKVFAKVRGYPPWPAKIEKVVDPNTKHARYSVYFYGTGETAQCKVDELFDYLENKAKYGKTMRRKFFNEGIQQLEEELGISAPNSAIVKNKDITDVQENISYKPDDSVNESTTATSSDTESKLVIDEREPKKGLKRKTASASQNNTPDVPEVKRRKVGRPSLSESKKFQQQQEAAKLEASRDIGIDSQDEENAPSKEMISRSGRKIKPKRYTDFADTPEVQKSEHSGRTKVKPKVEENETQSPVNIPVPKEKPALERVNNVAVPTYKLDPELTCGYVLTRTFAGEYVGIIFKSEPWDWSAVREALKLKTKLENGDITTDQVKDKLDFNVVVSDDDKKQLVKDSFYEKCKVKWLRDQQQLLHSDQQIRTSLALTGANADECLEAMEHFSHLPLDAAILKSHPIVVDTIKRLRLYVGNVGEWNMTEEEMVTFKKKAEQIRQKAEDICNRFKSMFLIPDEQSFWQVFSDQVMQHQKLTESMTDEEKWSFVINLSDNESPEPKEDKIEESEKEKSEIEKETSEVDKATPEVEKDTEMAAVETNDNPTPEEKMEDEIVKVEHIEEALRTDVDQTKPQTDEATSPANKMVVEQADDFSLKMESESDAEMSHEKASDKIASESNIKADKEGNDI